MKPNAKNVSKNSSVEDRCVCDQCPRRFVCFTHITIREMIADIEELDKKHNWRDPSYVSPKVADLDPAAELRLLWKDWQILKRKVIRNGKHRPKKLANESA